MLQLIKAEDTGGLSSTATVNIKVSDINDKNPEFVGLPYEFSVLEGMVNTFVGKVSAVDADEGQNAVIYYSVPDDTPFAVDAMTGEIRTRVALDYEKQQVSNTLYDERRLLYVLPNVYPLYRNCIYYR
jgi:protocadherin-15